MLLLLQTSCHVLNAANCLLFRRCRLTKDNLWLSYFPSLHSFLSTYASFLIFTVRLFRVIAWGLRADSLPGITCHLWGLNCLTPGHISSPWWSNPLCHHIPHFSIITWKTSLQVLFHVFQYSTDCDPEGLTCRCLAQRDYTAGEQFTIHYSQRPNTELFLHNGFTDTGSFSSFSDFVFCKFFILCCCFILNFFIFFYVHTFKSHWMFCVLVSSWKPAGRPRQREN